MRIGQRDHLPGVGRVGQYFLIAGHGGVEHHFTDGQAGRAYGFALEYGAVFEDEDCGLGHGNLTLATEGAAEVTPALHGNPVAKKRGRAVWDRSGFRDSASANCSAAGALAPAVIALYEQAIAHSFQPGGVCGARW